jgi:hypothetical protein
VSIGGPNGPFGEADAPNATIKVDVPVASAVRNYLVSGLLQHVLLLLKNNVFTSRLLIGIVNEYDLHGILQRTGT